MAGAGYKLFNTGDVLLASEVNTYLQQQVTMVFANATARTSALSGVLAEGMMSYLQDTNTVEVYNGTSWVSIGGSGDITEVQAGTGISVASGTGPIPVITNTVATAFDAAGDLIYGTGSDTFAKLALGTAGQVLKVNSGATAPEWGAAPAPAFVGCSVSRQSGNQSITQNTTTAVSFTNEDIDTDGFFAIGTSDTQIVIPSGKGGKYLLTGSVVFGSDVTTSLYVRFYKNGAAITSANAQAGSIRVPGPTDLLSSSVVATAVATDNFQMMVYQNSASTRNVAGANFTVTYLGA